VTFSLIHLRPHLYCCHIDSRILRFLFDFAKLSVVEADKVRFQLSAKTRKPIRVIRGFKLPSPYAPEEGYRFDSLRIIEKVWIAKGLTNGPMVCRYASRGFRRLIARRVEKKVEAAEQVAVNLKRRKTR
jgi:hypothetical protein